MIERKKYLERLIARKENGLVKVITGIRRCGKSYLLFNIYKSYLKSIGVEDEQIICLALDDDENIQYRNPLELGKYIRSMTTDESKTYYVFLDEIQKVVTIQNPYIQGAEDKIGFVDVVLGLMKHDNIDVYVTGSNSKMLSSDILTEFRGRGDEIRVNPLSFEEFYHAYEGDKRDAWQEYYTYGGLPLVMMKKSHEEKAKYLQSLFDKIYLGDIIERNKILHDKSVLDRPALAPLPPTALHRPCRKRPAWRPACASRVICSAAAAPAPTTVCWPPSSAAMLHSWWRWSATA